MKEFIKKNVVAISIVAFLLSSNLVSNCNKNRKIEKLKSEISRLETAKAEAIDSVKRNCYASFDFLNKNISSMNRNEDMKNFQNGPFQSEWDKWK